MRRFVIGRWSSVLTQALDARDSKLDLAGVAIAPGREAFRTAGACRLLLSVCPVRTPDGGVAYRHGFVSAPTPVSRRQ
jgi:hypothetical protein